MSNEIRQVKVEGIDIKPTPLPPPFVPPRFPPDDLSSASESSDDDIQSHKGDDESDDDDGGDGIDDGVDGVDDDDIGDENRVSAPVPAEKSIASETHEAILKNKKEETKTFLRTLLREIMQESKKDKDNSSSSESSLMTNVTQHPEDDAGDFDVAAKTGIFSSMVRDMEKKQEVVQPEPSKRRLQDFFMKKDTDKPLPLAAPSNDIVWFEGESPSLDADRMPLLGAYPPDLVLTPNIYTHIRHESEQARSPIVYILDPARGILHGGSPFFYPSDNLVSNRLLFSHTLALWSTTETLAYLATILEEKWFLADQEKKEWPIFDGWRGNTTFRSGPTRRFSKYLPPRIQTLLHSVTPVDEPPLSWREWMIHRLRCPGDYDTHIRVVMSILERHMDVTETDMSLPLGEMKNPMVAVVSLLHAISSGRDLEDVVFDDAVSSIGVAHFIFFQKFMALDHHLVRRIRVYLNSEHAETACKLNVWSPHVDTTVPLRLHSQDWAYILEKAQHHDLFQGLLNGHEENQKVETRAPLAQPPSSEGRWSTFFRSLYLYKR